VSVREALIDTGNSTEIRNVKYEIRKKKKEEKESTD
jgi:hypothetical protein